MSQRENLADIEVDARIILKRNLKNGEMAQTTFNCLGAGSCEHDNVSSGSMKGRTFLD
jgi:hypothetical protein